MLQIEKYRYALFATLAVLTVAAFLGLRGSPSIGSASDLQEVAPMADEITSGNCGVCKSKTGALVDCDKLTQKYTCVSKGTSCASICQ